MFSETRKRMELSDSCYMYGIHAKLQSGLRALPSPLAGFTKQEYIINNPKNRAK